MNSRTFSLLLLLANVALFGWLFNQQLYPSSDNLATSSTPLPADVPTLRLLSELPSPPPRRDLAGETPGPEEGQTPEPSAPPVEPPPVPTIGGAEAGETAPTAPAPETAAPVAASPETAIPPTAPACYTLGPFADETQRAQVRQSLAARLQSVRERGESSGPGRQWVYLGPYPSTAAAEKEMTALKARGVEDLFVVRQGANKNTISLGLFKEKTSVTERIREMKALGYEAHVEARHETPPSYWLDVAVDAAQVSPAALQEALPGSAQTKVVDCAKIAGAGAAQ